MKKNDAIACLKDVKVRLTPDSMHCVSMAAMDSIQYVLDNAVCTDTENCTVFPDFECDKGIIEYFSVGSIKEFDENPHPENMKFVEENIKAVQNRNTLDKTHIRNDSLDNFHKSFESNWKKHIDKLRNSGRNDEIVIFMIDSYDVFLSDAQFRPGFLMLGDLKPDFKWYCLAYDMDILHYLIEYADDVDFVIFRNAMRVEVIQLEFIKDLIRYMKPWNFKFST